MVDKKQRVFLSLRLILSIMSLRTADFVLWRQAISSLEEIRFSKSRLLQRKQPRNDICKAESFPNPCPQSTIWWQASLEPPRKFESSFHPHRFTVLPHARQSQRAQQTGIITRFCFCDHKVIQIMRMKCICAQTLFKRFEQEIAHL